MARQLRIVQIYAAVVLAVNIFLAATQIPWKELGNQPNLDFSKEFASNIVMSMQELAQELGIAERSNVKQALAKLHYDAYLAESRADLANIIQNAAADTRELIISEYINASGERVLITLNNATEVQNFSGKTTLSLKPHAQGGYYAEEPHILRQDTLEQLSAVPSLFSFASFQRYYETYRDQATLHVEIENGKAQLIVPHSEQDTLRYWERELQNLRSDYARYSRMAGFSEVSGPGITITISEIFFPLEAQELRQIVSELYSAGAIAIAINGYRLAVNSYIIESEGGISVDGFSIDPSLVTIEAVGDQQTLITGIDLLFNVGLGMYDAFHVDIDTYDKLVLPGKIQ